MVNKKLRCEGYGPDNQFDSTTAAKLKYSHISVEKTVDYLGYRNLYIRGPNYLYEPTHGDSGGTCFYYEAQEDFITGIISGYQKSVNYGGSRIPGT